jgi:crossover junction endodeoxyribonuclease RuvC
MGCGIIQGVIGALQIPMTLVSPPKWKAFFNLINHDKEAARQRAIQLWPHLESYLALRKNADRAEALLIGEWFYIQHVIPTEGRIAQEVRE